MKSKNTSPSTKTTAIRYVFVGIFVTLFNYILFTIIANIIIIDNNLLWLSSLIATAVTVIIAYICHSKITWKHRQITRTSVIKFFIWNVILAVIISPLFTQIFSLLTPIYNLIYNITSAMHLPFTYEFVLTTGSFVLTNLVIMVLNFLLYDRFVFGAKPKQPISQTQTSDSRLMNSKVSIIVPIYNVAKYLPACLDSIIGQAHHNLEILLIDDGSTDDSGNIADTYAKKDHRITVIHQKNQGQSAARNYGLSIASGDYISFVDGDDEIKSNFIKELLNLYSVKNVSLAVCGHQYNILSKGVSKNLYHSDLKPRHTHESPKAFILKLLIKDGRLYSCNNKLFDHAIVKKHHLQFDEKLNFAEDTKFVLDYLTHAPGEIAYSKEPLYIYNSGTETSTMKKTAISWQNWQTSYRNLKSWLGPNPSLTEFALLHLVHLRWRISYLRARHRAKQ